jgi:hypothetical protein
MRRVLFTFINDCVEPIRSTPAHDHQLEKVYLHRAKPHLINSLPASPGDKTMTVREVLFMLQVTFINYTRIIVKAF